MSSTIFRQYDSRWGSLPYPTKNSSFAGNGCGCCSVTHLAIENPKYAKLTPKDVRKFMVKYAVSGKGTMWDGIPKGLKNYGYKDVVHISASDPMSKAFKYIKQGYTMGVILFSAGYGGTTSKVYWTAGGHYIAFNQVKNVTDTDAYFFMKDSGGRKHDGWYSYQKSMKGRVYQMWLVKPQTKVVYVESKEALVDDMKKWAKEMASDNSYKYRKWGSNKYTHMCPICHPESNKHATKGWNCIGFVCAIFYHGGGLKHIHCNNNGFHNTCSYKNMTLRKWKAYNGSKWTKHTNDFKKLPESMLQAGDVLMTYDNNGKYHHTVFYMGDGMIADATSGKTQISIRKYSSLGYPARICMRPLYTKKVKKEVAR